MDEKESDGHFVRRWISVGDLLMLAVSLTAIATSYGRLATIVGNLQDDVRELHEAQQGMTPQAREQIAELRQMVIANAQTIAVMRSEAREGRQEVLQAVHEVDRKLDQHMDRSQPR